MGEFLKSVDQLQKKYDQSVAAVMADLSRSEAYKMEEAERLYDQTRKAILAEVEAERKELEMNLRATRRLAFEAPKVSGAKDTASSILAYRDALDRVEKVNTESDLDDVLQKAELVGDEYIARAVLVKAYELGSSKVVGRVLEFRPELTKLYQAYMDAAEAYNKFTKVQNMFGSPGRLRKPEEFKA